MSNLIEEIDKIVPEGSKNRHSFFQLQYFVISKEPTTQARIHACKRELYARRRSMASIMLEIEQQQDSIRLSELEIEKIKAENKDLAEYHHILIRKTKREIYAKKIQIDDLKIKFTSFEEEANFIIGMYQKLIELEPEKDWDSLEVQANYWNAKFAKELEFKLLLQQPISIETYYSIMSMPDGLPTKQLMKSIVDNKKQPNLLPQKEVPTQ